MILLLKLLYRWNQERGVCDITVGEVTVQLGARVGV